jgi:hypothetical protein
VSVLDSIQVTGADNVLLETDFAHPARTSPWPARQAPVPKDSEQNLGHVPDDVLGTILHDNVALSYHLD